MLSFLYYYHWKSQRSWLQNQSNIYNATLMQVQTDSLTVSILPEMRNIFLILPKSLFTYTFDPNNLPMLA